MIKIVRVTDYTLKFKNTYAIIFDDINVKCECDSLFVNILGIKFVPTWGKNIILKFGNDISMVWTAFMVDKHKQKTYK